MMNSEDCLTRTFGPAALGVLAVALVAITLTACARPKGERMAFTVGDETAVLETTIPPIDTQAPAQAETATFALG